MFVKCYKFLKRCYILFSFVYFYIVNEYAMTKLKSRVTNLMLIVAAPSVLVESVPPAPEGVVDAAVLVGVAVLVEVAVLVDVEEAVDVCEDVGLDVKEVVKEVVVSSTSTPIIFPIMLRISTFWDDNLVCTPASARAETRVRTTGST